MWLRRSTKANVGLLINIEGIDGSGKGTQAAALRARLQARGISVASLAFPRYQDTFFGARCAEFLNGRFGSLTDVQPFFAALLYAGDRLESRELLHTTIAQSQAVILDRYVSSNLAHQGSKLHGAERTELLNWIEHVEYNLYGLPRPDLVILLDLPVEQAQQLVSRKGARDYTSQLADLQEADAAHLACTREAYLELAQRDSAWRVISCVQGNELKSIEQISEEIDGLVNPLLSR